MDFEEQRRIFAMNMGGHPMANHHGTNQQAVQQAAAQQAVPQVAQQVQQPPPHTRILMPEATLPMVVGTRPGPMDATMATITTQMAGTQQITMHHTVHQQQLAHHHQQQHAAQQQVAQQQVAQQQQQPQPPAQQQQQIEVTVGINDNTGEPGPSLVGVLEETVEVKRVDPRDPLSVEGGGEVVDGAAMGHSSVEQSRWCLVCDKGLPVVESPQEYVDLYKATMTVSQRKLSAMLGRLVGLTLYKAHSDVLCRRCYGLVDQVDGLEIELADTKMELLQQYEATIAHRQPHAKKEIERPSLEVDVEWEESNESDVIDNDDDDPDCTATGTKRKKKTRKMKRKGGRPRKVKLTTKIKMDSVVEGADGEVAGRPRKRGRGRPRKKDKEEDDYIPPGAPTKDCPACKKVVHAKKYLIHLSTHRLFPCPFCESVFKRKDVTTHLAEAHQEEIHYPCPNCSSVFDTFTDLRQHCLVVHIGVAQEEHFCTVCNKSFSSASAMKVHRETIHDKIRNFKCPGCEEIFNKKTNMQTHYRRVHEGLEVRRLHCDICDKGFLSPSELRKHVERVHLKVRSNEISCPICGKPFGDLRDMKVHLSAVHNKDIKYPCPDCKMVFYRLNDMVNHKRRMHGGNEVRTHLCPTCGKGFCSKSDLRTHISVVHEDIRKHICDICDKAFKVASHLTYHKRRHTGETPFQCPYCKKSFCGPGSISEHIKKVHKTVYIGVAQRRKLNIPDTAPPPPPGILPMYTVKPKPNTTLSKTQKLQSQPSKKSKGADKISDAYIVPVANILPNVTMLHSHGPAYQPSAPSAVHSTINSVTPTVHSPLQSSTAFVVSSYTNNTLLHNSALAATSSTYSSNLSLDNNPAIQNNSPLQNAGTCENSHTLLEDPAFQNSPSIEENNTIIPQQTVIDNISPCINMQQFSTTDQNTTHMAVPMVVRLLQE
ncbi:uncharacterized protein [Panulirus ornatus]|uniref:uncharacterized protein isoform X1 n=1 Tax=Panulirus ornatus TaxID=150431 RepID=UPI003A84E54B